MKAQFDASATASSTSVNDRELEALVCEISEKLDSGSDVQLSEYEQKHPALAERLRQIWPTLLAMAELGHLRADEDEEAASGSANVGTLGDFQLIREVGRGGMGVVYEAKQISLERRVALKVLPFASVMDSRALQRFKNEALAAAALEHPNIVNVHSTGCERSVHYYAMHFVDGLTLAEVIAQRLGADVGAADETTDLAVDRLRSSTPQPVAQIEPSSLDTKREIQAHVSTARSNRTRDYFRSVAEIGRQAAEALDYAHGVGVVHRDIKPSNLMLDDAGKCWVTDFGLAMVESSPNLTMTGDLLGTLRYMSPEQALAKRVVVDHRTDVYSLGVTIYELLTLQPAHSGGDREEQLRRLAFEEPTPPRQVNPSIPSDLETIILKAIRKNPGERYATAGEFAADLQRYLDGQPIQARRPTMLQRAIKWSNRHKPVVAAAVVVALATIVGLAVSNVLIAAQRNNAIAATEREKQERRTAQQERERAERNLYLAEMRQASNDLSNGSLRRLRDTLEQYQSDAGKSDLRRWEWYYLRSLLPENLIAGDQSNLGITSVSWTSSPQRVFTTLGKNYVSVYDPSNRTETRKIGQQDGIVSACDVHEESSRLATGSNDGSVRVWDGDSGHLVMALREKGSAIEWVRWSPNGRWLGVYDSSLTLTIWDVEARRQTAAVKVDYGVSIDWRPPIWNAESTQLAVLLDNRRQIVLLNVDDRVKQIFPDKDTGAFRWNSITWDTSTGDLVAVGFAPSDHGNIECWDAASGELNRAFPRDTQIDSVLSCALSPDGKLLATASNEVIDVWDFAAGTRIQQLHGHKADVRCLVWSADGQWLASASDDKTIRLWNAVDGYQLHAFHGLPKCPDQLAVSSTGEFLSSRCSYLESGLRLWAISDESTLAENSMSGQLMNATPSPDGKLIATIEEQDLRILNARTGTVLRKLSNIGELALDSRTWGHYEHQLVWSPDANSVAWIRSDSVGVWELRTDQVRSIDVGQPEYTTQGRDHYRIDELAWSPDGRRIAVGLPRSIVIIDVETGTELMKFQTHAEWRGRIAWGSKGLIATAVEYGWVHIWDTVDGRLVQMLPTHDGGYGSMPSGLAWSNDGQRLAIGYGAGVLKLWNAPQSSFEHVLTGHAGEIRAICWNPEGDRLATHGEDDTVRVWDVASGGEILVLEPGGGRPTRSSRHRLLEQQTKLATLVWCDSGRRLYWLKQDGSSRQWDAASGYKIATTSAALDSNHEDNVASTLDGGREGEWALPSKGESEPTASLRQGMKEAFDLHNRALAAIESGELEVARSHLREERVTLDALTELVRMPHDPTAEMYHIRRRCELGVEFCNVGYWSDANEVFGSLGFLSPAYTRGYRRYLWHYVLALTRIGDTDRAHEIFNELVERFPPEEQALDWDKRLMVEAARLLASRSDGKTPRELLGSAAKYYDEGRALNRKRDIATERWDEVAKDLVEAIDRSEDRGWWGAPRLVACREAAASEEVFTRVAKMRPDCGALWIGRGQRKALEGQWNAAREDFRRGLHPTSVFEEVVEYAALLLLCGDRDGYAKFCEQLAARPGEPHDAHTKYFMANVFALGGSSVTNPTQYTMWARDAVAIDEGPWRQQVLGLCLYRDEEYDEAISVLKVANEHQESWPHVVKTCAAMAMCHSKLGNRAEASRLLNRATDLMSRRRPKVDSVQSYEWLTCNVQVREAKRVLEAGGGAVQVTARL